MRAASLVLATLFAAAITMLPNTAAASSDARQRELIPARISLPTLRMQFASADGTETFASYRVAAANADFVPPKAIRPRPKASLGVFSSVAISAARLPASAKYRDVTSGNYAALFSDDCADAGLSGCDTSLAKRLSGIASKARELDAAAKLSLVNREVNRAITYRSDSANWNAGDYWATPSEIARKGAGDCEDYAITKLWMLRALGVPADRMQVVVLSDVKRRIFHAVLVVHQDGEAYVLDNLSDTVRTDRAYPNYQPIMSFVANRSYIHGFETPTTAVVAFSGDLTRVRPGEGL